ncbi:hypothetical protein NFI96_027813 [Prochilodus magdalenae]|nr:hypothetical protein NFI96_027813 [Prochilodus magdalenae]
MDDFDMLGNAGNGVGTEEDPAAAFLAQQESEIAGIEQDEGFSILDSGEVPAHLTADQHNGQETTPFGLILTPPRGFVYVEPGSVGLFWACDVRVRAGEVRLIELKAVKAEWTLLPPRPTLLAVELGLVRDVSLGIPDIEVPPAVLSLSGRGPGTRCGRVPPFPNRVSRGCSPFPTTTTIQSETPRTVPAPSVAGALLVLWTPPPPPTGGALNGDLHESNGPSDAYAAISNADRLQAEPESLRKWREEQRERLEDLDANSRKQEAEWKEKAKVELEEWHARQDEQLAKTKVNNRYTTHTGGARRPAAGTRRGSWVPGAQAVLSQRSPVLVLEAACRLPCPDRLPAARKELGHEACWGHGEGSGASRTRVWETPHRSTSSSTCAETRSRLSVLNPGARPVAHEVTGHSSLGLIMGGLRSSMSIPLVRKHRSPPSYSHLQTQSSLHPSSRAPIDPAQSLRTTPDFLETDSGPDPSRWSRPLTLVLSFYTLPLFQCSFIHYDEEADGVHSRFSHSWGHWPKLDSFGICSSPLFPLSACWVVESLAAPPRAAEEAMVSELDENNPGTEWERVARLCDFNPKSSKQAKDVSRMRSVLISLKQSPLVR